MLHCFVQSFKFLTVDEAETLNVKDVKHISASVVYNNKMDVGVIVIITITSTLFLALCFVLCLYRHRLKKCFRFRKGLKKDEITITEKYRQDNDIAAASQAEVQPMTLATDDMENIGNGFESPVLHTAGSSSTSVDRFNNSQYSAISLSCSEASIKRGMHNSSWENTPSNMIPYSERNDRSIVGTSYDFASINLTPAKPARKAVSRDKRLHLQ